MTPEDISPDASRRPGKLPIYLSALAFPGAGQFAQKRWIPAVLYTAGFAACFVILMANTVRMILANIHAAQAFMDGGPNEPFVQIGWPGILIPFGIGIIVYIFGLYDTWAAYRRESDKIAEQRFAGKLPRNILPTCFFFIFAASTCLAEPLDDVFRAVRSNDVGRIDKVIEEFGLEVIKGTNSDAITPLHLASALDRYNVVAFLISAGADVNARSSNGFTPLHWAAGKDAFKTAGILIKAGADVNATASSGITPLHWAASKNSTNIVTMLIAAGARVDAKTDSGMTPLHWATSKKSVESARWIAFKIASDQVDGETNKTEMTGSSQSMERYSVPEEPEPAILTSVGNGVQFESNGKTLIVSIGLGESLSLAWIESLKIWVGKYEVTNNQYRRFKPDHNSMFRESFKLNRPYQPVVYVSWEDAVDFCKWLNKTYEKSIPANHEFRLPTEKEWKACAKCGTDRKYPWGDEWPPKYGNFSDLSAKKELSDWAGIKGYNDGFVVSCPVTESGSNEWNIFGLAGNVWEWCEDWYDAEKKYKTRHGGSWDFDNEKSLRIEYRGFDKPDTRDDTIGFRVVVAPKK